MSGYNSLKIHNGSITIYLALTITIILSLIFCVIESARITSIKVRTKAVTYCALDSAFSYFAIQLYEKYGIFGVFTTEEGFLSLIKDFAEKNSCPHNIFALSSLNLTKCNINTLEYNNIYHMTDNDGLIFASQAIQYEKYRAADHFLTQIAGLEKAVNNDSIKSPGRSECDNFMITDKDISLMKDISADSDCTLYKDMSSGEAADLKDNAVSKITALLKSNLLLFFIDNPTGLSDREILTETADTLPSHTCVLSENAKAVQSKSITDTITSAIDKGLFLSYINNSFSSYFDNVNPDISLKYQREYLLSGKLSDNDNLLSSAMSIVNLRAALNFTYLLSDSEKRSAAINLASSVCRGIPILSQMAAFVILSSWSYGESIIDVRDLFKDKKVPLFKSAENWTLSIDGILSMNKNTLSNNSGEIGYSYDEYLNICLLTADPFTLYYRAMDLIQLDICENYNSQFLVAACITGADINAAYSADSLLTNIIKLASPDAYNFHVDMLYGYD